MKIRKLFSVLALGVMSAAPAFAQVTDPGSFADEIKSYAPDITEALWVGAGSMVTIFVAYIAIKAVMRGVRALVGR